MNKNALFRELHARNGRPLVLANVWDAGSARLVEGLGAEAIATTSAGVAWSLGYPDDNALPINLLIDAVKRIVGVVNVPVTIDVEAGYSDNPAKVVDNLMPIFETGIVGINIEDGTDAPALLAKKIQAIKKATDTAGLDIFVNARTDVYLKALVPPDQRLSETLQRAETYTSAGANGLFVPAVVTPSDIATITANTALPLNVLAVAGLPKLKDLADLNVRRLSAGSAISLVAWERVARSAKGFLSEGDSEIFSRDKLDYGSMQKLFRAPPDAT